MCGQRKVQWSEPEYWLCSSVGYYSTWLWIRLSILSCWAIPQDLCRSLIFSLPIGGEIKWQLFFLNQSTVFTKRCDWTNVGYPANLFKGILIDSNLPVTCWNPLSFIVVLTASKTSNFDLIRRKVHSQDKPRSAPCDPPCTGQPARHLKLHVQKKCQKIYANIRLRNYATVSGVN